MSTPTDNKSLKDYYTQKLANEWRPTDEEFLAATKPTPTDNAWLDKQLETVHLAGCATIGNNHLCNCYIGKLKAKILTHIDTVCREAESRAVRDFEGAVYRRFDYLCKEVREQPNLGNSSKGKKDNFLDGAETMLTHAQSYSRATQAQLNPNKDTEL